MSVPPVKGIELSVEQMSDCLYRMVENHPWSGESHYLSDLISHIFTIAMCGAFLAGGLLLSILTSRKSLVGVFLKLSAIAA